jgi:hypothetical protein
MSSKLNKTSTIIAIRKAISDKQFPTMSEAYERVCQDLESGKIAASDERDCIKWLNGVVSSLTSGYDEICREAERRAERDAENAVTGFEM